MIQLKSTIENCAHNVERGCHHFNLLTRDIIITGVPANLCSLATTPIKAPAAHKNNSLPPVKCLPLFTNVYHCIPLYTIVRIMSILLYRTHFIKGNAMFTQNYFEPHIKLKIIRETLKISRNDFALLLGAKYRTFCEWEKHPIKLPCYAQMKLAEIGININFIYGGDDMLLPSVTFNQVLSTIKKYLTERLAA